MSVMSVVSLAGLRHSEKRSAGSNAMRAFVSVPYARALEDWRNSDRDRARVRRECHENPFSALRKPDVLVQFVLQDVDPAISELIEQLDEDAEA